MTFDENDYDEFSKEEKEKGWVIKIIIFYIKHQLFIFNNYFVLYILS